MVLKNGAAHQPGVEEDQPSGYLPDAASVEPNLSEKLLSPDRCAHLHPARELPRDETPKQRRSVLLPYQNGSRQLLSQTQDGQGSQ
jgi:hypothetical protein